MIQFPLFTNYRKSRVLTKYNSHAFLGADVVLPYGEPGGRLRSSSGMGGGTTMNQLLVTHTNKHNHI